MKADIKIWILTGDKQETAINIGNSPLSSFKLMLFNRSICLRKINLRYDFKTTKSDTVKMVNKRACSWVSNRQSNQIRGRTGLWESPQGQSQGSGPLLGSPTTTKPGAAPRHPCPFPSKLLDFIGSCTSIHPLAFNMFHPNRMNYE